MVTQPKQAGGDSDSHGTVGGDSDGLGHLELVAERVEVDRLLLQAGLPLVQSGRDRDVTGV